MADGALEWSEATPERCDHCGYNIDVAVEPGDSLAAFVIEHRRELVNKEEEVDTLGDIVEKSEEAMKEIRKRSIFTGPRAATLAGLPFLKYSCSRCGEPLYMETKHTAGLRQEGVGQAGGSVPGRGVIDTKVQGDTREIDHRTP